MERTLVKRAGECSQGRAAAPETLLVGRAVPMKDFPCHDGAMTSPKHGSALPERVMRRGALVVVDVTRRTVAYGRSSRWVDALRLPWQITLTPEGT